MERRASIVRSGQMPGDYISQSPLLALSFLFSCKEGKKAQGLQNTDRAQSCFFQSSDSLIYLLRKLYFYGPRT